MTRLKATSAAEVANHEFAGDPRHETTRARENQGNNKKHVFGRQLREVHLPEVN